MGLFRRKEERNEIGQSMAAGMAASENSRPQSSQDALDQTLGINPYLLYDEESLRMIQSLAFQKQEDGQGNSKVLVNPKFAALAIAAGYTPRASKLDAIDAEIAIREAYCIIRRIKMKMTEAEYEAGGALVCDAILNTVIIPNNLSGVGGFIAKLTKVSPKSMEVTYREDKTKNKESFSP